MPSQEQIRDIVRSELYNHEFRKTINSMFGDSTYYLKKDITRFCEQKIELEVTKKIVNYREEIFKTIRSIADNDPIIIRNIANISAEFSTTFTSHCNKEIMNAKNNISEYLRSEVNKISSLPPYEHICRQMREENKRDMDNLRSQSDWVIGGMAMVNISLLAILYKR